MVACGGPICSPGECSCSEQPLLRGWRATWPWEFARAVWGAIQTRSTGQISQDLRVWVAGASPWSLSVASSP